MLWGAESWSLHSQDLTLLSSFHHKSLRKILNINMWDIENYHISNLDVCSFFRINNLHDIVSARQLRWLGLLSRRHHSYLHERAGARSTVDCHCFAAHKLLLAWAPYKRPVGRPQQSVRAAYSKMLRCLFPQMGYDAPYSVWRDATLCSDSWHSLIGGWLYRQRAGVLPDSQRAWLASFAH